MSALVAFFLAEIGDKAQIATVPLAARFEQIFPVILGTTFGMVLANMVLASMVRANIPRAYRRPDRRLLPVKAISITAAAVAETLAFA